MHRLAKLVAVGGCSLLLVGVADVQEAVGPVVSDRPAPATAARPPAPPQERMAVPPLAVTGRTIKVAADGDLQKAIDESKPGDLIALEPGATYKGPFRLRARDRGVRLQPDREDQWTTIASAATDLPPAGQRVAPSHAARMPKLVAEADAVFIAEPGAHHYRLSGLHITPADGVFLKTLVQLGEDEKTLETLPHHVIVERSYIHGDPKKGSRRGVSLNGRHIAVVDSYVSDFKETGADSQAISGWNGPGPFRIANNYLEAAGENVMFGGADPSIAGLVPSDIEVVRNHMTKPLRWKAGHPSYEGTEWSVKNLFELKNARRVVVDGNLLEYNWPHAQNGFAILFTVRNQDGAAPWSVVEDVTFANNLVRHVAGGINILGSDDNQRSQQTKRIAIRNNVFLDVGGAWGNGRLFQLLDGTSSVVIENNTALHTGSILFAGEHDPHTGFVFQNNVVAHNEHGITGGSTGPGTQTIDRYLPGAVIRKNVLIGAKPGQYPSDNFFPATLDELGTVSRGEDFRLTLVRPYARAGTDGRDPGANIDVVTKALGGMARVGVRSDAATRASTDVAVTGADDWDAAAVIFWLSLVLIGYTYAGYPVIAAVRARLSGTPRQRAPIEPLVSVIVVACNEAERIEARIENLLELDYPRHKLEIIIASDGSTDDTVVRAQRYESSGVRVRPFDTRRGKSATLNAVVPFVRGEIIVFADARQRFDRGAVRALAENFADPTVGGVSGQLVLTTGKDTATAAQGTALYWRYEKFIRSTEGRAHSMVGATGAIYAIRREMFEGIPDDTLLDDVLVPLRIVRRGLRVVFEPEARAYDSAPATARHEFVRKARTAAGNFQLFARERWLFNPFRNAVWFETMSHKALRLALPVLNVALLVSSVVLAAPVIADATFAGPVLLNRPAILFEPPNIYVLALAGQLVFYAAALVGYAQRNAGRRSFVFSIPCAICLHSWVTVVGFYRFITNNQQAAWERLPNAVTTGRSKEQDRPYVPAA